MLRFNMLIKIHKNQGKEVIAICDEDIIGKTFEEKDLQLKISEYFYKGEKISDEDALIILKTARNINIAGKKAVNFALKNKIIEEDNIITIAGVPNAQVYEI